MSESDCESDACGHMAGFNLLVGDDAVNDSCYIKQFLKST